MLTNIKKSQVIIHPSKLHGQVTAPASKSAMQRACAAALLAQGTTKLHNPGNSNDDKAALDIVRALGATVSFENEACIISSKGLHPAKDRIDCGESGLSCRMFTPIAALHAGTLKITGAGSLLTRPMHFFDKVLPQLGVTVKSNNGHLPFDLKGPLKPTSLEIDGSLSSQFLTGLLLAYAAAGASDVTIRVKDLKSRPYIDLTLEVMSAFGLKTPVNKNYREFHFPASLPTGPMIAKERNYSVEGDWSGGAFLLVAGAIAGPLMVRGLDMLSTQADKAILDILIDTGAGIANEAKGIKVHPSALYSFRFDATDCPDLFPPLVALASYCGGESVITGVHRLSHKESNRAITLQEEFAKMNVQIDLDDDQMIIHGGKGVEGAKVHSRQDHRIAMALAVAALHANGETVLEEAEAVAKSYPGFFNDLEKLGATLSLSNKLNLHE